MNPVISWAIRWFDEEKSCWHCSWFDSYYYFAEEIKHLIKLGYKKENILVYEINDKLRDEILESK